MKYQKSQVGLDKSKRKNRRRNEKVWTRKKAQNRSVSDDEAALRRESRRDEKGRRLDWRELLLEEEDEDISMEEEIGADGR